MTLRSALKAASAEAVRRLPPGRSFALDVAGTSMEPVLRAGDRLEVRRLDDRLSGLWLGDLVVLDPDGLDPDGLDPEGLDPEGLDPDGLDPDGLGSSRAPGVTGLVVHRLLWRGRDRVRTRGDGSGLMDRPLTPDRVVGRVVRAHRGDLNVTPPAWRLRLDWARHFTAAALRRLGLRPAVRTKAAAARCAPPCQPTTTAG